MSYHKLVKDLKLLLAELKEYEELTQEPLQLSGMQLARVKLEVTLEENGISRTSTLNNVDEKRISTQMHTLVMLEKKVISM